MAGLPDAGKVISDAWDHRGRPSVQTRTGGWSAAAMILIVELCERLTTLGIAVNLVTYLTGTMHLGSAAAANAVTNFMGASFLLCLLGGFLADTFLGRYRTIAIFAAVQASGVAMLAVSTAAEGLRPPPEEKATAAQMGFLYMALYLTALGTGGLKSSVSGFGSDQFDESDPEEKAQMLLFFNWFFFFISLGSLMAVTFLVYIQDNVGRPWGYGVCAAAVGMGLAVFLAGTRRYRFKRLVGSPLTQIAEVVVSAWRKRGLQLPEDPRLLYDGEVEAIAGGRGKTPAKHRLPHTEQFRFLDHAAINTIKAGTKLTKWLQSTLTDVEEVKTVVRMLPIWATTVMFWTVYAQMSTFSVAQAAVMDRRLFPSSPFFIPAGSLTFFFVASILLTVPFYDRVLVPLVRRLTRNPHCPTPLQRIAVGLLLSAASMAAAAAVETRRRNQPENGRNMSVFWLVPQFFLVGSGEAFTYIGQLDFFLRECPEGMKTMSTGLFLSTLSLGFFVSSMLVAAVHRVTGAGGGWLPDDLNKGKLYDFYWLLSLLCLLNFGVYLVAAKWYKYKVGVRGTTAAALAVMAGKEEEGMCHA